MHTIDRYALAPADVATYHAGDYRPDGNCVLIEALGFFDVRSPNEPLSHGIRVREDIMENGIKSPVIIVDRSGSRTVIDGHHRAVLAVELGIHLPANIIFCDCEPNEIAPNLRCEFVDKYCYEQYLETKKDGWVWTATIPVQSVA